jgi:hypothetical protein
MLLVQKCGILKETKSIIGIGNGFLETSGKGNSKRQNPEPYNWRKDGFTEFCFVLYKNRTINMVQACPKNGT